MKLKKSKATLTLEAMIIFPIIFVVVIAGVLECFKPIFEAYATEEAYTKVAQHNFYFNSEPDKSSETGDIYINGDIPYMNVCVNIRTGNLDVKNNDNTKENFYLSYSNKGLSSRRKIYFNLSFFNTLNSKKSQYNADLSYVGKKPSQVVRYAQKENQVGNNR
jgi:hypothetical protein